MIRSEVPRFRQIIALLLLVLWTPVVSHCLLEDALGARAGACCECGGSSDPGHSDCATCLSVESGLSRTDPMILPVPRPLDLAHEFFPLLAASALEARGAPTVLLQPDDTPPVPPAAVIQQATIAQPVRGPSPARA